MKRTVTAVDEYVNRSADFARPILRKLRTLFHRADPRITESMKWGVPHFEYMGIIGSMAAFKEHVSIGFWKGGMLKGAAGLFESAGNRKMSMLRIRSITGMPSERALLSCIREAVELNEKGIALPVRRSKAARLVVPAILREAFKRKRKAGEFFASLSKSHQREYIEWLKEAKRDETRQRRLATMLQWLDEGKPRNWKYVR